MTRHALISASTPWPGTPAASAFVLPPPWTARSICGSTPDVHFSATVDAVNAAKRICIACPVRTACLDWALARDEEHGVWGGFTREERARLDRGTAAQAPVEFRSPAPRPVSELVIGHLQANQDTAFTAGQLAKAIGRHKRTVDNVLKTLAAAERVMLVHGNPRRYAAGSHHAGHGALAPISGGQAHGEVIRRVLGYVLAQPDAAHTAAAVAVALPDLKPKSVSEVLFRLAGRGAVKRLPGKPARFVAPEGDTGDCGVAQCRDLQRRRDGGESLASIAADLGVSRRTVSRRLASSRHPAPDPVLEGVA